MGKFSTDRNRVDDDLPPPSYKSTMETDMEMQVFQRRDSARRGEPTTSQGVWDEDEVTVPITKTPNTRIRAVLDAIHFFVWLVVSSISALVKTIVSAIKALLMALADFLTAILTAIFDFRYFGLLLGAVAILIAMAIFFATLTWLIGGWIGAKDVLLTLLGFGNATSH